MYSSILGWCACPPSGTNTKNLTLKFLESDLWKREKGEGKREKEGRGREKRTEEEVGGREERRR